MGGDHSDPGPLPEHPDPVPGATRTPEERRCTRNGCQQPALATLTYIYAASTAVVGPLAVNAEPHTYDLCGAHARSLTAPRGWELVRHDGELVTPPPRPDDLAALAEAVWGTGARPPDQRPGEPPRPRDRRGHLRLIPPP
ncbi:DUF3499 domain-containing protein [Natronosporangium hydrolyticum]|uniref:DUF3499 domain-containing protein n=1 Tax=Natronosporangium hydrolyticum TaxID=2811111 RepID=A0A895YTP2_9ACTN|nr:DUF3499 domain-containing protein [Natronosporangium hydrolyticum]